MQYMNKTQMFKEVKRTSTVYISTFIFCHIKERLKFQSLTIVHHTSNFFLMNQSNSKAYCQQSNDVAGLLLKVKIRTKNPIPVLVNVWPLYETHRRSSSSNLVLPLRSSSLPQPTRSRKLSHSSV